VEEKATCLYLLALCGNGDVVCFNEPSVMSTGLYGANYIIKKDIHAKEVDCLDIFKHNIIVGGQENFISFFSVNNAFFKSKI